MQRVDIAVVKFQSLGRDSVHSSSSTAGVMSRHCCFNPSVGILFIQAPHAGQGKGCQCSFNPSVGILFIQARSARKSSTDIALFQSLGRDSVHSSISDCIPAPVALSSFNPSVGILFIQAKTPSTKKGISHRFQSLGRDSVHSST